jgi:hypothetical protein
MKKPYESIKLESDEIVCFHCGESLEFTCELCNVPICESCHKQHQGDRKLHAGYGFNEEEYESEGWEYESDFPYDSE